MLFEPINVAGIQLNNRIMRSATYEKRADEDGFVTELLKDFYVELVRGGAGFIVTGNALVHPSGRTVPQMLCAHSDMYVKGFKELTGAVHEAGGKIALQLVHGGRQCLPVLLGGKEPIAPSVVHDPVLKVTPREITEDEIREITDAYGDAALRARLGGFDAVQIHGAHGYLAGQFLSPHTNRRDDYWGGDEERRFHFLEDVYKAMRKAVGKDFPIMIKMNSVDGLDGGLTAEESARIAVRLEELGIDAVEVSGGIIESKTVTAKMNIKEPSEEAYFRQAGALFKEKLTVPVMLVGGMRTRAVMQDVLEKGEADLVSLGRPLIREPNLPNLMKEGKDGADCISCNGCMRFMKLDMVKCVQLEKNLEEKKEQ